jgi:hypothetical protein
LAILALGERQWDILNSIREAVLEEPGMQAVLLVPSEL